jgi:hypothetical protein
MKDSPETHEKQPEKERRSPTSMHLDPEVLREFRMACAKAGLKKQEGYDVALSEWARGVLHPAERHTKDLGENIPGQTLDNNRKTASIDIGIHRNVTEAELADINALLFLSRNREIDDTARLAWMMTQNALAWCRTKAVKGGRHAGKKAS